MIFRSAVCPVHVGRAEEVAALAEALAGVGTRAGRFTLVGGEAGVGKSRLVAESTRLAAGAGFATLEGQSTTDAQIPYGVFVTAIRRRTRTLDTGQLRSLFDGPATLAAALLPEVATEVDLPSGTPTTGDLFAAVWQLLSRLSRPAGAILVLEDLHWADQDSLRLLGYLARELTDLPLWLVGTYRVDEMHRRHPLAALLSELGRERRFDEIRLEPLDPEGVRDMLSAIFDGTEVGDEFTEALVERTGGNPFFVEELAKMLVDRGDIYHDDVDWQRRELSQIDLPLSVRETLLARARTMSPSAFGVLRIAAVAGDEIDVAVVGAAAGVPADEVDDAIREGLDQQVLLERREPAGSSYAFRHALSREAFADELVGPDRREAHRAVARAVAAVHADDVDAVAAALADHHAAAGDDAEALGFALRAARRAAGAFARDEADRRFDQALTLMPADDERRLGVLLEAAGDTESGAIPAIRVAFAQEARRLALAREDPVSAARAVYVLQNARWLEGDGPGAIALLREALAGVRGKDDFEEAQVLRRLSRQLTLGDHLEEALALIPEGLALAERSGNLEALSGLHGTRMLMQQYGAEFHESCRLALDAAHRAGDLRGEMNLRLNTGYVSVWAGDFSAAAQAFAQTYELAATIAPADRYPHAGHAWLLALSGDYDAARALAEPLLDGHPRPVEVVALTALAEVTQRTGEPGAAELVDRLWSLATGTAEQQRSIPALAALARQRMEADGVDAALPLFEEAAATTRNALLVGSHWGFSPDLARGLAGEGRVGELESWCEHALAITRTDGNPHNQAAYRLCRAFLLSARGDSAAAVEAFDDAAARYRAMPCPAREVEALLGRSEVEWRSGAPDGGSGTARRALEVADSVGAAALTDRAKAALERSQAQSVLATILFTDIVGSTELAASLGDRAWRDLLQRHHAIVRRELSRTAGRELDTAGDGFLVAFDTPGPAIRFAGAVRAALAQAGIAIRAGLHTGECQESGGKLTGLTVHIAARVCSAAGSGEVLVSGTVRDLVAGSGLRFEDRGRHQLKGVPGEWHLFAVD
jgi:predicted ATPase/class 3 adenylate cyclase